MMIFKSLIESLAKSVIHISSEETNSTAVERFRIGELKIDQESLTRSLSCIRDRDSFSVSFEYADSDQADSLSRRDSSSVSSFCDRLRLQLQEDPDVKGVITVKVTKGFSGRACSIYSLSLIEQYWRAGGIASAATKLWALAEKAFIIESPEIQGAYNTGLFVIRSSAQENTIATNPETTNKDKLLSARNKGCLFYENKNYPFIPQDFNVSPAFEHAGIADLFNTLKLAFSIIFLADITSLDDKALTATIKGYRHVTGTIQLDGSRDTEIAAAYYEIYQWAYSDGSITDKLGIARNLLSIHINGNAFRNLQDGSMPAIISNYSIYLKDSVKQYIEIKNKLSDQIQKQSEKASEMVKSIGSYLRASIFSVYSFVITTFIIRSMSKASADGLFSDGVYLIFIMFIFLSVGTLLYAYKEAEAELRRFESIYDAFKSRFDDLLSKSDRERILQNDKEYKRDVEYVKESRKRAVYLWLSCLLVVFIFVTIIKLTQTELVPPAL
ncbi:hypothetical protein [Pseudomonas chlororaphis]|uniref:hypothetical protein n=1 Tax=Pseudomonas chlororaphis TaxID=587753 RepID=UPI0012603AFC|nr:hypothetical protein [Pseudomonas chlororaphis]